MTTTLKAALKVAVQHWSGRPGGKTMVSMATACVSALGDVDNMQSLGSPEAVRLLSWLRDTRGLSPKSVSSYYGAFKRMLTLAGHTGVSAFPDAPKVPRVKAREPMKGDDLDRLIEWLRAKGWRETADLAVLLRGTGLRVRVEALAENSLSLLPRSDTNVALVDDPGVGESGHSRDGGAGFDVLRVIGKGGHERFVPVTDQECRAILSRLRCGMAPEGGHGGGPLGKAQLLPNGRRLERIQGCDTGGDRLTAIRSVPYSTHLERWSKGVAALGVTTKLPTPHAARHFFATRVLEQSGGHLSLVQELLGHADPATTARYLQVDMAAKVRAMSGLS